MTSSRIPQENSQVLDIESMAADIQRGIYQSQTFFNDSNLSNLFSKFNEGVQTASNYSGAINLLVDLVDERDPETAFRFTKKEHKLMTSRAESIAAYGNIPLDVVIEFLMILCYVDKLSDMKIISEAVAIPELNDEKILRRVDYILAVPNLEKIAYMASAVEGLVNMFRKYLTNNQITNNNSGESMIDVISSMASGFGNMGNLFSGATPGELAGNFLSELLTGARIPMNVIAKNPNLQSPSYIGKAFFGESPTSLSNIDIEQLFNKKIGVFPIPSAGAGTTSFGIQNLSSFTNQMSVKDIVAKITTGSLNITPGSIKDTLVNATTAKINQALGTTSDEVLSLIRADTAIPVMAALSATMSNSDRSPFTTDTFKNAWMASNALSNHLQNSENNVLNAIKRFL